MTTITKKRYPVAALAALLLSVSATSVQSQLPDPMRHL